MFNQWDDPVLDGYDPDEEIEVLDGFDSDDGKHHVVWQEAEITPNLSYDVWWCQTHNKIYYGGCLI